MMYYNVRDAFGILNSWVWSDSHPIISKSMESVGLVGNTIELAANHRKKAVAYRIQKQWLLASQEFMQAVAKSASNYHSASYKTEAAKCLMELSTSQYVSEIDKLLRESSQEFSNDGYFIQAGRCLEALSNFYFEQNTLLLEPSFSLKLEAANMFDICESGKGDAQRNLDKAASLAAQLFQWDQAKNVFEKSIAKSEKNIHHLSIFNSILCYFGCCDVVGAVDNMALNQNRSFSFVQSPYQYFLNDFLEAHENCDSKAMRCLTQQFKRTYRLQKWQVKCLENIWLQVDVADLT